MKNLFAFLVLLLPSIAFAQTGLQRTELSYISFIEHQRKLQRPSEAMLRKSDTLQRQFRARGLKWPAKYVYFRSFKYDSQLEVWVRQEVDEPFRLFKTYKVCALAGTLGPKRMEGDYQVPEGFYYINEFNHNSSYYLSLGLNYPNPSDRILSDSIRPGGAIYIHGACITVGCIPVTDEFIDELYILAAHAKDQGQDFIPVHIFPVRYNVPKSRKYLDAVTRDDPSLRKFADRLEDAFDYFEKFKKLPVVMIADNGEYIIEGAALARQNDAPEETKKRPPVQHRTRNVGTLPPSVQQWPQFAGGSEALTRYFDELGRSLVAYLPKGVSKLYVQVEFIVDSDGVPTNFRVLRGTSDQDLIDELITRMESMPSWKPALLNDRPVPKKMVQTVVIMSNE
ncbi:MAG TPA: L,D-transpeptidase family protein [Chitinophagaceae bacterium]|nr:L,D-transpeptidase family protein [Chitinophagaceae bacterium]